MKTKLIPTNWNIVRNFRRVFGVVFFIATAALSFGQFNIISNGASPQTAGTLYVDLRPDNVSSTTWTNFGALGNFASVGNPSYVTNVYGTGVPGVLFDGASAFEGPLSVTNIDGDSDRSIEVWVFNPSIADEESLVSLGHRGVTRGNLSLNFGGNANWGGASHFADDLGWNVVPTANAWHHLVYTYDAHNVYLYADGALHSYRLLGGPLATFPNEPINLGCQRESAFGQRVVFFSGYINMIRVHDHVLTADQVRQNYQLGPIQIIPSPPPPPPPNTNNYPGGLTITFSDVGQLPWNVVNYGKIPENYQPSELLGSGVLTRWINVAGYTGGQDHTTGTGFNAFEQNGGLSPSIVLFNQHVFARSLWVDTYGGRGVHVYVRGYTYTNDPVPVMTIDVSTLSHPFGTGYRWVQVTNLDGIPLQKLTVESSVFGENAQFDDLTIQLAPTNNIPPRNFLRDRLTIMPLGDSITWGLGAPGGYRTKLFQDLKRAGYQFSFIGSDTSNPGPMPFNQQSHQGHPGYTIYEDDANLDNNVPPYPTVQAMNDWNDGGYWVTRLNRPPDIILIHLGTNDIGRGQDGNGGAAAAANMDALLTHLYALAPQAKVILAKIIPINWNGLNPNAIAFNSQLAAIVVNHAATGQHITLVDQYTNFVDDTGAIKAYLLGDGVHPRQAGYDLMADTWFHGIRALFPTIVASNPPPAVVGAAPVENYSFETNVLADNGSSGAPGWISSAANGGLYNPQADAFVTADDNTGGLLPAPGQGRQLGYILNQPGQIGTLQQVLPDVYLANDTTYTLSVAVGRPLNSYAYTSDNFSGYKIQLLAGETVIASQQDSFLPIPGTFQDATIVFTASTNTVSTNLIGHALMVRLSSDHNPSASPASTFFDNVRLTVTPILPVLTIAQDGTNVIVRWPVTGYILQRADDLVTGLWTDVAGAINPYTNSATKATQFYRLKR